MENRIKKLKRDKDRTLIKIEHAEAHLKKMEYA